MLYEVITRTLMKKILFILLLFSLLTCKTFIEKQVTDTNDSPEIRVLLSSSDKLRIPLSSDIIAEDSATGEIANFPIVEKVIDIYKNNNSIYMNQYKLTSSYNFV